MHDRIVRRQHLSVSSFPPGRMATVPRSGLRVSKPTDAEEVEADRLADTMVRNGSAASGPQVVARKCGGSCHCDDCSKRVSRKAEAGHDAAPAGGTSLALGAGHPLPEGVRESVEPRFRHDFSRVRIHSDERAANMSAAFGARAFTVGHDIAFGAGEYVPESSEGRRLLLHELVHVVQQARSGERDLVRRAITVQNPAAATPNIPATTNAAAVQLWLTTLCPGGGWTVDAGTGVVGSPDRANFCAARPVAGVAHFSTSGARTSCGCLCELTAAGSTDVRLHAADFVALPSGPFDVNAAGEGRTRPADPAAGRPEVNVGVSGLEFTGIRGAGDTAPLTAGVGANQVLRDPPWLILGHEMCGHARLGAGHGATQEGDRTAVDVENSIRREHSTVADSLGIRVGEFADAAGGQHNGAEIIVAAGDTLSAIARRCGIPQANRRTAIFRGDGSAITVADENRVRVGERLLVEGIAWHEVILDETMTSIARMWNVPLRSLIRANPQIADPDLIIPRQRLLVPAS